MIIYLVEGTEVKKYQWKLYKFLLCSIFFVSQVICALCLYHFSPSLATTRSRLFPKPNVHSTSLGSMVLYTAVLQYLNERYIYHTLDHFCIFSWAFFSHGESYIKKPLTPMLSWLKKVDMIIIHSSRILALAITLPLLANHISHYRVHPDHLNLPISNSKNTPTLSHHGQPQ